MIILRIGKNNWVNIILGIFGCVTALFILHKISSYAFTYFDTNFILTTTLTINGIFAAILLTYLFSRINWIKNEKLETRKDSINLSRKITAFRRIMKILTDYYQVWVEDNETHGLLSAGPYKNIDYYDYRRNILSSNKTSNWQLVREMYDSESFIEGVSSAYLAMASFAKNRKADNDQQTELYKDFAHNGTYALSAIERWIDSEAAGHIWYCLDRQTHCINYSSLSEKNRKHIIEEATKINSKYKEYSLGNELIREIADDMNSHYLPVLQENLIEMSKDIEGADLYITILVFLSVLFGVLIPYILLIFISNGLAYFFAVAFITAINAGLFSFFILKFPFLISHEVKMEV